MLNNERLEQDILVSKKVKRKIHDMNSILHLVFKKKLRWYFDFFFSAVNSNEKIM